MTQTLYYHRTRTVNGLYADGWAFGPADADGTLGELRDDGPVDHIIPDDYRWMETQYGERVLYDSTGRNCWLGTTRGGKPLLCSLSGNIVLQPAMPTLIV